MYIEVLKYKIFFDYLSSLSCVGDFLIQIIELMLQVFGIFYVFEYMFIIKYIFTFLLPLR